jgi:CubicO group peptidase (beta-lactamase class C family)
MARLAPRFCASILALALSLAPVFAGETAPLDAAVEPLFALDMSPGMSVAAVRGSEIVYQRGFGFRDLEARRPVAPDTIFYIASTTKSFTAFAMALLHHQRRLDLDAPLSLYLPSLRLKPPLSADQITLRNLLTHTHGIAGGGPVGFRTAFSGDYDRMLLLKLLETYEPSPQGRSFVYGNLGYNIASLALDARFKTGWKNLIVREVLAPLGMKDTTASISKADRSRLAQPYAANGKGYDRLRYSKTDTTMHAAGGHVSTARDLARWIQVHLNGGRVGGRQRFPAQVVAEARRQQATQDRTVRGIHRYGWGLGWDLGTYEGDTLVHRPGSYPGFYSHVSFMPERGVGVVVLTNEDTTGAALADVAAMAIYDTLLAKPNLEARRSELVERTRQLAATGRQRIAEDRAKRQARPQRLNHPLGAFAGTYFNAALGCLKWKVEGERLRAKIGAAESLAEVYDSEKNQLRVELAGGGEVVAFSFQDGKAVSLTYAEQVFLRQDCR